MTYRNVKYINNNIYNQQNNGLIISTEQPNNTPRVHIQSNKNGSLTPTPTPVYYKIINKSTENVNNVSSIQKKKINEKFSKDLKNAILNESVINNFIDNVSDIYDKLIIYIESDYTNENNKIISFNNNHVNYKKIIYYQMLLQHECQFLLNVINTQVINDDSLLYELQPILTHLTDFINKKPLTQYLLESYGNLNNIHHINRSDVKKEQIDLYNASTEIINLHLWYNFHSELHSFLTHINILTNILKRYRDKKLIISNNNYLNFYN